MDDTFSSFILTGSMILISAFFVAAEFAFVKVRPSQLEIRAQQKRANQQYLL